MCVSLCRPRLLVSLIANYSEHETNSRGWLKEMYLYKEWYSLDVNVCLLGWRLPVGMKKKTTKILPKMRSTLNRIFSGYLHQYRKSTVEKLRENKKTQTTTFDKS